MYIINSSLQKVGSSITTSCYSIEHEVHTKNLHLHFHSDKAELLSIISVLSSQYFCSNVSKEPFKNYFAIGTLVIEQVHSI